MTLTSALNKLCTPKVVQTEFFSSSNTCAVILEPHYIGHGRIGGKEDISKDKVDRIVNFFSEFKECSGETPNVIVYIPGEEILRFPIRYMITPNLWDSRKTRYTIIDFIWMHRALDSVIDDIQDRSGVVIEKRSFLDISFENIEFYKNIVENSSEVSSLYEKLLRQRHGRYRFYDKSTLENHAKWRIIYYLAIVADLKEKNCSNILSMDADTTLWDVIEGSARAINSELGIWTTPEDIRQHFK